MFTDQPVTPLHVESLLTFLRANSNRKLTRDDIRNSFQPPSITTKQKQSHNAVKASIELGLISEGKEKVLELSSAAKSKKTPTAILREALDSNVLASKEVENYLALFYSYMLGLNQKALGRSGEEWTIGFQRDVFDNQPQENQFNTTKLTGLHRWMSYMGLGWYDQKGEFQCAPFERLQRSLSMIFQKQKKLECDEFMHRLSEACPELDGGKFFLEANKSYDANAKQCTLGLSHTLVDLHLGGFIKLHCPKDSAGWSIALANPPNDGKTLASNRISQVELGKGGKK